MNRLVDFWMDSFLITLGIGLVGGILAGIVALLMLAWEKIRSK